MTWETSVLFHDHVSKYGTGLGTEGRGVSTNKYFLTKLKNQNKKAEQYSKVITS